MALRLLVAQVKVVADHGAVGMADPFHDDPLRHAVGSGPADKVVAEAVQPAVDEALLAVYGGEWTQSPTAKTSVRDVRREE